MAEEIIVLTEQADTASHDAPSRDMSRHTMTIKQTAELFSSLGVPRSPRSVQRFCDLGNIDAIRVKGEKTERYFIDPLSVERYAEELRQLENISQLGTDASRHDASQRDTTRRVATESVPPAPPESAPTPLRETPELRDRVDTLEKENMQLKIDLAARVIVINQMADERRGFFEQVTTQSRDIGRLEMQVQQLAAPRPEVSRHDALDAAEPIDAVIVEQGREAADAEREPPAAPAQERRPGFFRRVFGGE